jgi:Cu2+-exporting ATPase
MSPAEAKAAHQQRVALGALGFLGLGMLTTPVVGVLGLPLLAYNYSYMMRGVWQSFRNKGKLSVVTLDALSVSFAIFVGFFFTAGLLFTALFTANRLVAKTEREAQTDFSRIFGELGETAWLMKDGAEIEVPLENLQVRDIVIVRAGEMIPVDGHVLKGEALVDQHLLTGESQPVEKKAGDDVFTSTLLISGSLQVVVEKKGADTITGQIAKTLEHAASFKHKVQARGERLVEQGASRTMLASALALPFLGLGQAMALSYSGFGYQMRTSAPLMVLNYLRIASRNGILVKDGRALDTLKQVDTIVFDKTGTLTEEVPQVGRLIACNGFSEQQLLQYAASAEQRQKHPIAQAICSHAEQQGMVLLEVQNTDYAIGHGLRVDLVDERRETAQQTVLIGSRRFVDKAGIPVSDEIDDLQAAAGDKGHSIVYVATSSGELMGVIELKPALRPQAKEAIDALHELGMTLYIISGDQEKPTRYLANTLGIDHYFAETLPEGKAAHIESLQAQGHKVCFIGDGINDSVALQKSDVSVSLHGAATIAQDTADILLMTPDLLHLPYLLKMSTELHQRMNGSEFINNAFGVACVSGVLLLGMGTSGAILLYSGGLLTNLSNSMLPLFTHPEK